MKLFAKNPFKRNQSPAVKNGKSVESAAISVFAKYDKTFVDLAKYDRGEKILDTVSH